MKAHAHPRAARPAPRRAALLPALALGALAAAVYANSLHAGFTLDNAMLILRDPRVHQASTEKPSGSSRGLGW